MPRDRRTAWLCRIDNLHLRSEGKVRKIISDLLFPIGSRFVQQLATQRIEEAFYVEPVVELDVEWIGWSGADGSQQLLVLAIGRRSVRRFERLGQLLGLDRVTIKTPRSRRDVRIRGTVVESWVREVGVGISDDLTDGGRTDRPLGGSGRGRLGGRGGLGRQGDGICTGLLGHAGEDFVDGGRGAVGNLRL